MMMNRKSVAKFAQIDIEGNNLLVKSFQVVGLVTYDSSFLELFLELVPSIACFHHCMYFGFPHACNLY